MNENPLWKSLNIVWDNPKYVFVNKKKIKEVADMWSEENFIIPLWEYPNNQYDFLEFMGLASSVNFCYHDPYNPEKERYFFNWRSVKYEGAYGMAIALCVAEERGIPLFTKEGFINCDFLQKLTIQDVRGIFCKDSEIPMIWERLYVLREVGLGLKKKCEGRFKNIFEKGRWTAFDAEDHKGIINILISILPSFYDASLYLARPLCKIIYFHKRAQLFLMIYQGRALAYPDKYKQIKDYELLGPPADYELPKMLRFLGILEYCSKLADKINKQRIILPNSPEEQEIRVQTINAMILLLDKINFLRGDNKINMLSLDYKIWSTGRNIKDIPHHLTPTIAY